MNINQAIDQYKIFAKGGFFSYYGGKAEFFNKYPLPLDFKNYYEPFIGAGGFFLNFYNFFGRNEKHNFYISDLDKDVYEQYIWRRDYYDHFKNNCNLLALTPEQKLKHRQERDHHDFLTRVKANFMANCSGINWIWDKTEKATHCWKKGNNPNLFQHPEYCEILKAPNVFINNCDFSEVFEKAEKGDFIFLDPPYYRTTSQYKHGEEYFGNPETFFKFCAEEILKLHRRGVRVLFGHSYDGFMIDFFKRNGFNTLTLCKAVKYGIPTRLECAYFNYDDYIIIQNEREKLKNKQKQGV